MSSSTTPNTIPRIFKAFIGSSRDIEALFAHRVYGPYGLQKRASAPAFLTREAAMIFHSEWRSCQITSRPNDQHSEASAANSNAVGTQWLAVCETEHQCGD